MLSYMVELSFVATAHSRPTIRAPALQILLLTSLILKQGVLFSRFGGPSALRSQRSVAVSMELVVDWVGRSRSGRSSENVECRFEEQWSLVRGLSVFCDAWPTCMTVDLFLPDSAMPKGVDKMTLH